MPRETHRPVKVIEADSKIQIERGEGPRIKCVCGFDTDKAATLDDAWDRYDAHTME